MHACVPAFVRIGALAAVMTLGCLARIAHAESVFKCRSSDGAIAFQDRPCASGTRESQVEIAPAPPVSQSPDYGRAAPGDHLSRDRIRSAAARANERHAVVSYECRAADGELFYRHGACPKQVSVPGTAQRGKSAQSYAVSAQPMPRAEVCRRLASAGSIGRAGHARDETVSTYDRNLGRDPCRYL